MSAACSVSAANCRVKALENSLPESRRQSTRMPGPGLSQEWSCRRSPAPLVFYLCLSPWIIRSTKPPHIWWRQRLWKVSTCPQTQLLAPAVRRTLFPHPCCPSPAASLAMLPVSEAEAGDLWNTASCPLCPLRTALAGAFWCFLAITGVGRRANGCPRAACCL